MRHRNHYNKLSRTSSHRRCLMANMLKSLIFHGKVTTTVAKAKALKGPADKMVTLAKKNTLASRRQAISELMIIYNKLDPKEARSAKGGDKSGYNMDRHVIDILFANLATRFASRQGGYTRITKEAKRRVGDDAELCVIEYLEG